MPQQLGKDIGLFLTLTKKCLETTRCHETTIELNIMNAQFFHPIYSEVIYVYKLDTYNLHIYTCHLFKKLHVFIERGIDIRF